MPAWSEERRFTDRADAGRRLAERLTCYRPDNPIVLALPRGGIPVGFEIARALGAPLDIFVARKLGAPGQPELAIGAVAQGGTRILNQRLVAQLGIPEDYLKRVTDLEKNEMRRRIKLLRGDRPEPELRGRTVVLVDDGLATGATARAAIESIRHTEPRWIVLTAPVCAAPTAEVLRPEVDELISLAIPTDLYAIGYWYEDFEQVSDEEVISVLQKSWRERSEPGIPTDEEPG